MILKNELNLVFDERNIYWTTDDMVNETLVLRTVSHLNARLKSKGYLYLNEIYEILGFAWDPDGINTCFKFEQDITSIIVSNLNRDNKKLNFTLIFVQS